MRSLEREIGKICRTKAVEYSASREKGGKDYEAVVHVEDVERVLGMARFEQEVREEKHRPGVVTYVFRPCLTIWAPQTPASLTHTCDPRITTYTPNRSKNIEIVKLISRLVAWHIEVPALVVYYLLKLPSSQAVKVDW